MIGLWGISNEAYVLSLGVIQYQADCEWIWVKLNQPEAPAINSTIVPLNTTIIPVLSTNIIPDVNNTIILDVNSTVPILNNTASTKEVNTN